MAERKPKPAVRVYPLPEAIPGHKGASKQPPAWRIREVGAGVPHVAMERGEMAVPLSDDPIAVCVRAHETGHARWSPARPPAELAADVVQAVEDSRIHSLLGSSKVDLSAGLVEPAQVCEMVKRMLAAEGGPDRRALTLAYLSTLGTGSAAVVAAALRADPTAHGEAVTLAHEAHRMLHEVRKRPKFEDTRRVAEWLQTMLATKEEARESERAAKTRPADEPGEPEPMDAADRAKMEAAKDAPVDERCARVKGANAWGALTIERPPCSQPLPRRSAVRRRRPATDGDVPRRLERYCVDGAVFVAGKRMRRGTVLIDQSGSMAMTPADVLAILAVAPAARIAAYAGSGGRGVLRVLADRGRRVADAHVHLGLGGNVVDGPALRWLARQPGPRLWVCDGVVTGVGDATAANLYADAVAVVRAGGIRRIPTVELAVKLMAEIGRR